MPIIPYQPFASEGPRPTPPPDYQNIPTTPREFGAQIGAGEERLGAGLSQVGQFYGEVAADQATNNWQSETTKVLYGDPNVPGDRGFYGLKGQAAMEAMPRVSARIEQLRNQMRDSLVAPSSQLQFDQYTRRMQNYLNGEIGRHYDQQADIWAGDQVRTQSDLALNWITSHATDEEQFNHGTADLMNAAVKKLQISAGPNPPADAVDAALLTARQQATAERVKALLPNNPGMAQQVFNSNQELLSGLPGYDALANTVKAHATRDLGDAAYLRASGAGPISSGAPAAGTTASQNLANNNPGNIKAPGGGWMSYPTREAGINAIGDWLQRAQANHGLTTIRQLIDDPTHGYAPSADPGNAGKNLPEAASRIVGVSPDAHVDMADPGMRGRMVQAILTQEQGPRYAQASMGFSDVGPTLPAAQQIPGIAAAEAHYARTLENLNNDPALQGNPEAYQHALSKAEAQLHASTILSASQERQRKLTADTAADSYVQSMMKPGTDLVALTDQIRTDPNLDRVDRENLWKLAESHMVGDALGQQKKDGPGIADTLRRITADDGDPNRITRPGDIIKLGIPDDAGQAQLSPAGVTRALAALKDVKGSAAATGVQRVQNGALAYAKHQLSFEADYGTFKVRDPKGEDSFNIGFTPAFFDYWQKGIAAGKTPQELVAPAELDKLAAPFKRDPAQLMRDRNEAGEEASDPAAARRKAADDYLRAHPELRGAYDQKYGAGSADAVLGAPGQAQAPLPPIARPEGPPETPQQFIQRSPRLGPVH